MKLEIYSDTEYTPGDEVQLARSVIRVQPEGISAYPLSLIIIADTDFQDMPSLVMEIVRNMNPGGYVAFFGGMIETEFIKPNILDLSKLGSNQNLFEHRIVSGLDMASKFHSQIDSPIEIIIITCKDIEFIQDMSARLHNIPINLISNTRANWSDIVDITNGKFIDTNYDDYSKYINNLSKISGYNCKLEIQMQSSTRLRKVLSSYPVQILAPNKNININLGSLSGEVYLLMYIVVRPQIPQDSYIDDRQILFTAKLTTEYPHIITRDLQRTSRQKHGQPINDLFIEYQLIAKTLYVVNNAKKMTDFDKSKNALDKVASDLCKLTHLGDIVDVLLKQLKLSYFMLYKNKAQMRYSEL
jgi:hypothetical protein